MDSSVKPPKFLFCLTSMILFVLATSVFYISKTELPHSIHIDTYGQPTIGYRKARVHLVCFEDPKCTNCRLFNNEIFPKIKKSYIDTHKINYTIIPVSFLPGSMNAAIAALCVYNEDRLYPNDELFFKFIDYLYRHQPDEHTDWASPQTLIKYAKATSPAINLENLQNCVDTEGYRIQIERNTQYGKQIMDGTIVTPTLYVNGILVNALTYDEISKLIDKVLEHEGQ